MVFMSCCSAVVRFLHRVRAREFRASEEQRRGRRREGEGLRASGRARVDALRRRLQTAERGRACALPTQAALFARALPATAYDLPNYQLFSRPRPDSHQTGKNYSLFHFCTALELVSMKTSNSCKSIVDVSDCEHAAGSVQYAPCSVQHAVWIVQGAACSAVSVAEAMLSAHIRAALIAHALAAHKLWQIKRS
ncbi:unnamed protein product, partial [Brenthis ino]